MGDDYSFVQAVDGHNTAVVNVSEQHGDITSA